MPRFHLETQGCKANLADSLAIGARLGARGYTRAAGAGEADLIVVNSCTVTGRADADLRQLVARLRRANPGARVVVTGCLATLHPAFVQALPGVDEVAGNESKLAIGFPDAALGTLWDAPADYPQFRRSGHTRAFVKVQEGCDARCSFCVIPATRGPSRSLRPERVIETVRALGESGANEVVLTGIHLGHYGRDLRTSLAALLDGLLSLARPERIRLTSVEPNEVGDELVARFAGSGKLAPHFHLPLQSGSDRVLARMRRPYGASRYRQAVERVARALDSPGIGADVIAGFPGESEEDFAATLQVVESLPLTYLHVFRYSPRPGTDAARLDGQVPVRLAIERSKRLRELGARLERRFASSLAGRAERALTVLGPGPGTPALTGRFVPVRLAETLPPNQLLDVRIDALDGEALGASRLNPSEEARACPA